jgi:chaperonin GroES
VKNEILSGYRIWHKCGTMLNTVLKIKTSKHMSNINIKPLADRVLVEPAAAEEKTASGIIIPDTAKEKPQKGNVVAVGTGKKDEPLTVKVGDSVLYGKYSGTEITVDGKEYLIMRESDIYAIV